MLSLEDAGKGGDLRADRGRGAPHHGDLQGLVRFGIDLKDSVDGKLVILDEGKEPELVIEIALFGAGLTIVAFGIFRLVGSRRVTNHTV